ncbi:MAG: hypothetical protein LBQ56_00635 [Synergistaceae bacterium]|jgi:hypothetical protein|nr:hypothetical protein [Synergistaceae bacterium]
MITTINAADVKSDMLTMASTVQEILRALYFYGTDYIMGSVGRSERLVHKEQLVALLEQGRETATLEDIMSVMLNEPLSAKMQIEDIPQDTHLLLFAQTGSKMQGVLSRMTFEEYRERKIREAMLRLPEWWNIPLPLLHVEEDRISLNGAAQEVVSCDLQTLAAGIGKILKDRIISYSEKRRDRTFSLHPLTDDTFLLEDISGDFEMAEDLVWWAAVGQALCRRMEDNALVVKRMSPLEASPDGAVEIIPCSWDGELVGKLAIELPDGPPVQPPADASRPAPPQVEERENPSAGKPARTRVEKKTAARKAQAASASAEEFSESFEQPGSLPRLNKNAARRAYGGSGGSGRKIRANAKKPDGEDGD